MQSESNTAQHRRSLSRVGGKIIQLIARKIPFLPGRYRALLQSFHGVRFDDWQSVFVGENVYFDDIYPGDISVGKFVRITANTRILSHYFDTSYVPRPGRPFRFYRGSVRIGNNVFIGVNSVIAKPLVIGDGAIVGANTVLTKDVPPNAIVVGSPAKIVGYRPSMSNS